MNLRGTSFRAALTAGSAAVLLFAVGWTMFGENRLARALHGTSMAALIPLTGVGGWRAEILPVAESPGAKRTGSGFGVDR